MTKFLKNKMRLDEYLVENEYFENLEIAKHFILAGAGFVPRKDVLRKALAALTYFESYFPNDAEETEYFLKPQGWEYDPTQVAHFSNIVGKALADKFFRKFVRNSTRYKLQF